MKVTTSWIQSYLGRTISDREIVDSLERAGIEIEQFSSSKALDENIVIAMVQKVRQHPEADRLHICEVFDGTDTFDVVCGAPNVREGLVVPFARIGSVLPSGDAITKAKLRGVTSNGMLCSGRELELSDDHAGLLELDVDMKLGTPIAKLYPADGIIDMKTAANRWDVLSVLGLAREVSGQTESGLKEPSISELVFDSKKTYIAELEPSVSRFSIAELTVDSNMPTPDWMAQRLAGAGVRSLGLIVDITNYVMLEQGQPLHAYDADNVTVPFAVRASKKSEKLTTLDDVERDLHTDDLVVADSMSALGLAGVMGGATSEVSDKTKRIYLEAATFDGARVRKSAKRHGLRSDASARFERGLPVQLAPVALARAVDLLVEHAGAKLVGAEDKLQVFPYEYRIGLRANYASKYLGVDLDAKQIVSILGRLGIESAPFDIVAEAKSHAGKPYKWGASFKTDRTEAFDCSYLTDYIFSLIGKNIGHTAAQQFHSGREIELAELKPGDLLFRDGMWDKLRSEDRGGVSHVALYIGDGKMVHAESHHLVKGEWKELPKSEQTVRIDPVETITEVPSFLGARRHVEDFSDWVSVAKAPWWRTDLRLEEDLIEELARLIGYDNIPSTIPKWHPKELTFDRRTQPERRLRQLLSGLGLYEVMTYSFVSEEQITRLGDDAKAYLKLKNPMSSEQAYLRRSLAPSHMSVLEQNRKIESEVGFYEISGVFHGKGEELPDEPTILGVTVATPIEAYRYAKGVWDRVAEAAGLDFQLLPYEGKEYASGRAVSVMVRGTSIGTLGQIAPAITRAHKLGGEVARFEIDLGALLKASKTVTYDTPSKYPAANRDITILVPHDAEWQKIGKTLNGIQHVSARYGGDYYSDELPSGYRALTVHLTFSSLEKTLTDEEVGALLEKVEQTLTAKFKAKSRS